MDAWVGLFGIIVGALIAGTGRLIYDVLNRRSRERDIVRAIYAEITASRETALKQVSPEEEAYVLSNDFPYAPADRTDFVFEQVRTDITIIPSDLMGPVVLYYKLALQTNELTEATMKDAFKAQKTEERRKFIRDLISLLNMQVKAADNALTEIEGYARANRFGLPNRVNIESNLHARTGAVRSDRRTE